MIALSYDALTSSFSFSMFTDWVREALLLRRLGVAHTGEYLEFCNRIINCKRLQETGVYPVRPLCRSFSRYRLYIVRRLIPKAVFKERRNAEIAGN